MRIALLPKWTDKKADRDCGNVSLIVRQIDEYFERNNKKILNVLEGEKEIEGLRNIQIRWREKVRKGKRGSHTHTHT